MCDNSSQESFFCRSDWAWELIVERKRLKCKLEQGLEENFMKLWIVGSRGGLKQNSETQRENVRKGVKGEQKPNVQHPVSTDFWTTQVTKWDFSCFQTFAVCVREQYWRVFADATLAGPSWMSVRQRKAPKTIGSIWVSLFPGQEKPGQLEEVCR